MLAMDKIERQSGVLLHITSLPSHGGVGDLGPAAYTFADFLVAAKQRVWQVLPLGPTGYGASPYSALSAFAGNPILISLERLAEDGWIDVEKLRDLPGADSPADFTAAQDRKLPLIEEAAANFLDRASDDQKAAFQAFCRENSSWLQDYALFNVLRRTYQYASWHEWPPELARRDGNAITALLRKRARELAIEQAVQFFFDRQWSALRDYCASHNISIMGDIAIFVSYDSADVWTNPDIFELDEDRRPLRVSGVPPDYFSASGQRWGNPLYKWDVLRDRGFDWWIARIRRSLALYDMIRLDHFRGFEAFWSIDAEEETAINGQWVKAPGHELFTRLKEVLGALPFIAEDLGVITPEVNELRERFGMPGMRILMFGFNDRGGHMYLPHRMVPNCVAYTGTHDNNTVLGWWVDDATETERRNVQAYLGKFNHPAEVNWAMIRAAARSVANLCVFPLQDILHLGSEARMNVPAAPADNWTWRFRPTALHPDFATQLAALMEMTDRDGYEEPKEGSNAGKPTDEAQLRAELDSGEPKPLPATATV